MLRFTSAFAVLLLVLSGCFASSGPPQKAEIEEAGAGAQAPAAPSAAHGAERTMVPPPTGVQFFNGSKPVNVWRGMHQDEATFDAGIGFKVRDPKDNRDSFGDDDQTLNTDLSIQPNQTVSYPIRTPVHRRVTDQTDAAAQVDVNGDYKTIGMWFVAQVGAKPVRIDLSVPDATTDDIFYDQDVVVRCVDVIEDGVVTRTRVTVAVKYKDSSNEEHPLTETVEVTH